MTHPVFRTLLSLVAIGFSVTFIAWVGPPLMASGDIIGGFAAGFVNPYAAGYALDTILCWVVLAIWVVHEARTRDVRHGWIALVLGVVPGVCVGFAVYLLLRQRRIEAPSHASGA